MSERSEAPIHLSSARRFVMPLAMVGAIVTGTAWLTWDRATIDRSLENVARELRETRDQVRETRELISSYDTKMQTASRDFGNRLRKVEESQAEMARAMEQMKKDVSAMRKAQK